MLTIIGTGRVGQEPQTKESSKDGAKFLTFTIATENPRNREETIWLQAVAFNGIMQHPVIKSLKKGSAVSFTGEPSLNTFTRNDGSHGATIQVRLTNIGFAMTNNSPQAAAALAEKQGTVNTKEVEGGDDIPF